MNVNNEIGRIRKEAPVVYLKPAFSSVVEVEDEKTMG
jgi:hypothetical protein